MVADPAVIAAVTQTMYRYARAVDRMDGELMVSCFAHDAHIYYGGKFDGTPQGFVDWLWPLHAAMVGHQHAISNVLVEQSSEHVSSESYVMVTLRMREGDEQFDYISRGRYLDRWEPCSAEGGGYRIVDRVYVSDMRTTLPVGGKDTSAQLPTSSLPPVPSLRDRDDPSYARLAAPST